jgi:hypothetical protein
MLQLNFLREDAYVYAMDIENINPTFSRMLSKPEVCAKQTLHSCAYFCVKYSQL